MNRLQESDRPLSHRISLRLGRSFACVVCDGVFRKTNVWDDHMGSPLAGYVSLPTCPRCREYRAVYPLQAAWFASHILSSPPGSDIALESWRWLEEAITIDGGRHGDHAWPAVHVYENGLYVPLRAWINSSHHVVAHDAYEALPRHRHVQA